MSLTEGTGANSSPESAALGELLAFFGAVADYAAGALPEDGEKIASLAVAMSRLAGLAEDECGALYMAARLRNLGVLGNAAFAKGEPPPERAARMHRWDIPAAGARLCEQIGGLPPATADYVRWQAECWDGTGYPDQLRWSGIPQGAHFLHIAADYVAARDPEDALASISRRSGQAYSPEQTRAFVMWFHTFGGEIEIVPAPYAILSEAASDRDSILQMLAARIDAHNGTPERSQRLAALARDVATHMGADATETARAQTAALIVAAGELRSPELESARFDALAHLGADTRANHALAAASLAERSASFAELAPVLRARSEWYDGTGGPDHLRHDAIPRASQILAAAVAFDALGDTHRMESAAGTQFDPEVIRALTQALRAKA